MRAVVDLAQAARVHVAVHLRRRERAVAEQLLDRAQVGAALEQVRGEGVPQAVRVGKQAAQRARVEPAAARREEERVLGAARELRPRLAQVDARPSATPPRRAARPAPCRPCRARARAPARSRRRPGRGRSPPASAGPPSRRARPARGSAARAARHPSNASSSASTSCGRGASGSRRGRRGANDASGHPLRAERVPQEGPHRRELAPDRRRRELARPRAAELGRVLRQRAHVDVLEPSAAALQPGAELLDVVRGTRAASARRAPGSRETARPDPASADAFAAAGRTPLRDRGDDLVREAREAAQELGALGLEALDQRAVLVARGPARS